MLLRTYEFRVFKVSGVCVLLSNFHLRKLISVLYFEELHFRQDSVETGF